MDRKVKDKNRKIQGDKKEVLEQQEYNDIQQLGNWTLLGWNRGLYRDFEEMFASKKEEEEEGSSRRYLRKVERKKRITVPS